MRERERCRESVFHNRRSLMVKENKWKAHTNNQARTFKAVSRPHGHYFVFPCPRKPLPHLYNNFWRLKIKMMPRLNGCREGGRCWSPHLPGFVKAVLSSPAFYRLRYLFPSWVKYVLSHLSQIKFIYEAQTTFYKTLYTLAKKCKTIWRFMFLYEIFKE